MHINEYEYIINTSLFFPMTFDSEIKDLAVFLQYAE